MTLSRNSLFLLSLSAALAAGAGCASEMDQDPIVEGPSSAPEQSPPMLMRELAVTDLLTPVALRDTILGGNATGIHGCDTERDYQNNHYEHVGAGAGTQLHVIGVYEPRESGIVDVHVTRPGSSVLFLSAYSPVQWNVTADSGSTIERIVVTGYHAQGVTAPEGVAVEEYVYEETGMYIGHFGYEWPSHSATDLVQVAEELTGATLASFRGCYRSDSFQIDAPGPLKPAHPVTRHTEPTPVPGCEPITAESSYCVAAGFGISMLGLDSGTVCGAVSAELSLSYDTSSLAWVGDYIYGCVRDRGLARISVLDGSTDIAPVSCEMVTNLADGRLLALASLSAGEPGILGNLVVFDTFEDAAQRKASHIFAIDPYASRIAVNGNRVYFAWHSTSSVETAVLEDGAQISSITLDGYDDWIFGMDVLDNGTLVIGGPARTGGIHLFDATGASLGTLASDFSNYDVSGLECVSGGAAAATVRPAL